GPSEDEAGNRHSCAEPRLAQDVAHHRRDLDRTTMAVLAVAVVVTGWALYHAAESLGGPGLDEMTEVPLMGAMFLAMVWHVERARKAIDSEQRLRERQA